MSLFGMNWAVGTLGGEILKRQNEEMRFARARENGAKGFYVPADLSVLKFGDVGFKEGRSN
jgi:hypothetical protein